MRSAINITGNETKTPIKIFADKAENKTQLYFYDERGNESLIHITYDQLSSLAELILTPEEWTKF